MLRARVATQGQRADAEGSGPAAEGTSRGWLLAVALFGSTFVQALAIGQEIYFARRLGLKCRSVPGQQSHTARRMCSATLTPQQPGQPSLDLRRSSQLTAMDCTALAAWHRCTLQGAIDGTSPTCDGTFRISSSLLKSNLAPPAPQEHHHHGGLPPCSDHADPVRWVLHGRSARCGALGSRSGSVAFRGLDLAGKLGGM